jgi:hypothetical protein
MTRVVGPGPGDLRSRRAVATRVEAVILRSPPVDPLLPLTCLIA